MPRNAEDCAGVAMLQIRSLQGRSLAGVGPRLRVFTPERVWHWPDLADPGTLADYVRQAIATAASGECHRALPRATSSLPAQPRRIRSCQAWLVDSSALS